MALVRNVLFALAALLSASPVAHAADDEVCLGWVHEFEDVEVDFEKNIVTFTSTSRCLAVGQTLEDLDRRESLPYEGSEPAWRVQKECDWLERQIDEMRRVLREAEALLPNAEETLKAALEDAHKEQAAYEAARAAWQDALNAVEAAKAAYEDVYEVEIELERHDGRVVIVRRRGYDSTTELGRAVVDAMQRERDARAAMNEAWVQWSGAGGSAPAAQAAQFRVDQYRNVVDRYPRAIEDARAYAAELGCQ